ncbi:protein unc-93 homolog A [Lampetra fluviatilis]
MRTEEEEEDLGCEQRLHGGSLSLVTMLFSRDTRDVVVISVGFLFLFTAFNALQNLQSSLNSEGSLGATSLSIVYISLVASCLFTPPALIHRLGCKRTMVLSMGCYLPYFAANFYPTWATMVPASIVLGAGAAPLWASKCAYLTARARGRAATVGRYFSVFFALFQSGQVWGNLVSSLVLAQAPDTDRTVNASLLLPYCGVGSCHGEAPGSGGGGGDGDGEETGAIQPSRFTVYIVLGVYSGCSVLGLVLVAAFVRPLEDEVARKAPVGVTARGQPQGSRGSRELGPAGGVVSGGGETAGVVHGEGWCRLFLATMRQMKDHRQLLLIPLTMYSGLEQAFLASDFTKSMVTCALGLEWIGFVMICYGAVDSVFSFFMGRISQLVGQPALFLLASLTNASLLITMYVWTPRTDQAAVLFAMAALWGAADAVWQTQLNALYAVLFATNKEAAFANYRLWESLGFAVAFAYSGATCFAVKMAVALAALALGLGLYGGVVVATRRGKRRAGGARGGPGAAATVVAASQ